MKTYYISIMLGNQLLQYLVEVQCFEQLKIQAAKNLRLLTWRDNKLTKNFRPSDLSWAIWEDLECDIPLRQSLNWRNKTFLEATWE